MTTAQKLDQHYPVLHSVSNSRHQVIARRNPLLTESEEIFDMMGWSALPDIFKLTIAIDLIGFRDELSGLYSTRDPHVMNRRKRIHYWVNLYLDGGCSVEAAVDALKVSYLY